MADELSRPPDEQADRDRVSYAVFGARFFEHAVTKERILAALRSLTGDPIEFGPIGTGPWRLAQVSASGLVGAASAEPIPGDEVAFRLSIPVDLERCWRGLPGSTAKSGASSPRELDKPQIRAARDIDVGARIDRAWRS